MTLITRQGKGSKLTIQEMDGNLTGLNTGKFQGDIFRELVKDNIGIDIPENGFYQGSEKIDGVFRFDPDLIFDILQQDDFEALKSPVLFRKKPIIYIMLNIHQVYLIAVSILL
jgi:hypothetical protein